MTATTEAPVQPAEPVIVDAVELAEQIEDLPIEDLPFEQPEGYVFEDAVWPTKPAKEAAPKPVNPFLDKVDALVAAGEFPSAAVAFTDKDDDATKGRLRRQLAAAAGDRATARLEADPIEGHEGWARYRFRLEIKRHRKAAAAPIDTTAPPAAAEESPVEVAAPEEGTPTD